MNNLGRHLGWFLGKTCGRDAKQSENYPGENLGRIPREIFKNILGKIAENILERFNDFQE